MRRRALRVLLCAVLGLLACGAAVRAQAAAPQRIVTLAPHLAELVCAAGACERLVGVSVYSDYPQAVRSLPQVGDATTVSLETVLRLKPDLVLAWSGGTSPETIARLRGLGLRVEPLAVRGLGDVAEALTRLGTLLGTGAQAGAAAQAYREHLQRLRRRWEHARPVRVVYQIETAPAYTVNGHSPISEAIALCGGVNVFAALPQLGAPVSAEAMLAAAPQAVLYGREEDPQAIAGYWSRLPAVPAVRAGNLFAVDPDLLARAAPRLLDGVEQVCEDLERARTRLPD
ncbi:MAG: cobalamin-binding protein [Nevskia sp.]|nr:cobalamin-binding protein [Nevskia sp.]